MRYTVCQLTDMVRLDPKLQKDLLEMLKLVGEAIECGLDGRKADQMTHEQLRRFIQAHSAELYRRMYRGYERGKRSTTSR